MIFIDFGLLRSSYCKISYLLAGIFSRPSSGLLLVHYGAFYSPFPFMFLFVFVFYHATV